jgi:hypothetical protein
MSLTEKQVKRLITPVRESRTKRVGGNTYVPAHEVRAELSRIFGPGNWDSAVHNVELIYEDSAPNPERDNKVYWRVCYRAAVTLQVRDYQGLPIAQFTEFHAEECAPQPNRGEAHALALTSVESYALRRAAIGLGDAFGLHLYDDGSLAPLIRGTLMLEEVFGVDPTGASEGQNGAVSDEQRQVLADSLGATVISESGTVEAGEGTPAPADEAAVTP